MLEHRVSKWWDQRSGVDVIEVDRNGFSWIFFRMSWDFSMHDEHAFIAINQSWLRSLVEGMDE